LALTVADGLSNTRLGSIVAMKLKIMFSGRGFPLRWSVRYQLPT
jgi:hypothetical protein